MKKNYWLIPCRLESTRLPKKALLNIDGLPLIIHTLKRVQMCKELSDIMVCTDSDIIKNLVKKYNGKVYLPKKS